MYNLIFSSNLKYYCIQFINYTTFEKITYQPFGMSSFIVNDVNKNLSVF